MAAPQMKMVIMKRGKNNKSILTSFLILLCVLYRTMDIAARGLLFSSSFVKDIVTGKKPLNTCKLLLLRDCVMKITRSYCVYYYRYYYIFLLL